MTERHAAIEPTVTPQFTRALLQSAMRRGIAVPRSLACEPAGDERVALSAQDRLWAHLCAHSADPLIGLELGLSLQVGHLDTAGLLLMSSATVGAAIDALLEYHPIVGEGGRFELRSDAGCSDLIYRPDYAICRNERVEAVIACLLNIARWATNAEFPARVVRFTHAPLAPPERYQRALGVAVAFGASHDGLCFEREALSLPLSQANPALYRHLQRLARDELDALISHGVAARVERLLLRHPHWSRAQVAAEMNTSERHLARRLGAEGTRFKRLRDDLRRRLAEAALQGDTRVDDVAQYLGFADAGAFSRAFRRWSGVSPAGFRAAARTGESPGANARSKPPMSV